MPNLQTATPLVPSPFAGVLQALHTRFAVKKFLAGRDFAPEQIYELLEILRLTPSSMGMQLWHFVAVVNPQLRAELRKYSYNQAQVEDASAYIVLCIPTHIDETNAEQMVQRTAEVRGQSLESLENYARSLRNHIARTEPEKARHWMENQVYIALGNLLTACAVAGVGACPMEGFVAEQYDQVLGLAAKGLRPVVSCAIGFHDPEDRFAKLAKVRYPHEKVSLVL